PVCAKSRTGIGGLEQQSTASQPCRTGVVARVAAIAVKNGERLLIPARQRARPLVAETPATADNAMDSIAAPTGAIATTSLAIPGGLEKQKLAPSPPTSYHDPVQWFAH